MNTTPSILRLMFVGLVIIVGFQCILMTTTNHPNYRGVIIEQQYDHQLQLPSIKNNNNNNNNDLVVVKTVPRRQGFHLLKDMIDWNLPSLSKSKSSQKQNYNYTKTICTTSRTSYPAPTFRDMFTGGVDNNGWSVINPITPRRRQQQQQQRRRRQFSPNNNNNNNNIRNNNGNNGNGVGRQQRQGQQRQGQQRQGQQRQQGQGGQKLQKLFQQPSCSNSLIRVLWEQQTTDRLTQQQRMKLIEEHKEGIQLTSSIIGGSNYNKAILTTIIQNSNQHKQNSNSSNSNSSSKSSFLLKDSIPITRIFNTTNDCIEFCNNEWQQSQQQSQQSQSQQQKWIWKPKNSMQGKGIILIGENLYDCRNHCRTNTNNNRKMVGNNNGGGGNNGGSSSLSNLQAQMVADTMYLDDGRKFDVRSHILIANVNPLIVYTGAERVRICAESIKETNPTPFPYNDNDNGFNNASLSESKSKSNNVNSWNPFQQVCNTAVGKKHPIKGVWSNTKNVGPLSKGIPNIDKRNRVISKLDQHNMALVELLHNNFIDINKDGNKNKVGMFQVYGADYLIDINEKIWFLELNKQPGFTSTGITFPNPFGDILQIEWTILQTYNEYHYNNKDSNGNNNNNKDDWKTILNERLSNLELEVLRRQQ